MAIRVWLVEVSALKFLLTTAANVSLVVRDVRERGRDVEGCIKQWFGFVKPNFEKVHTLRNCCEPGID